MTLPDRDHPIWNLLRLIVLMIALTVILMLTATKFDQSEIKTIILTFVAGGGALGAEGMIRALRGKD